MLAPDSWSAYQRNTFSEPTLLDLPTERKALNFLTWDIWFPFINANFFDVPTTWFWCNKLLYIPALFFLFGTVFQYLRCYVWA